MGSGWDHLAIRVNDVDEVVESIDHFGLVNVSSSQSEASAYITFIEDLDGHLVEPLSA